MKRSILCILVVCCYVTLQAQSAGIANLTWQRWTTANVPSQGLRRIVPSQYTVFAITNNALKNYLFTLPLDRSSVQSIQLPVPDGSLRRFRIWADNIMAPGLADKYPDIRTFSGFAEDNHAVTVKLDFTTFGFHAMVFDPKGVYFIDPYSDANDGFYQLYYKADYQRSIGNIMQCGTEGNAEVDELVKKPTIKLRMNGQVIRTFRLALACTGEYAVAVAGANPTKAAVLSKMITSINRINGVYEREIGVHMNLVANEDTLIFLDGTNDPYTNASGGAMLSENQDVVDTLIGSANYDIGHVFSTGGGGIAMLGSVCQNIKAMGVTGQTNPQGDAFDIDYVAHEMGHQFGADHTFNTNTGSCGGNGAPSSAYEPGSGSTIMAYAGICGGNDNLQSHSDPYFHARSLEQINDFLTSSNGATCASTTASNNNPPVVDSFTNIYSIPVLTPFELTAPAVTDADHDTLTYCWEEWNRGNANTTWTATTNRGPIFRSFNPDSSATRVFPRLDTLVDGITSYRGEKLPATGRFLTFKLTVRDILNGFGTFNFPDDTVHLDVIAAAGPFIVMSPATAVNWLGNTPETVTWDVAGTDVAPINCTNVDILLSVDGGYTYPYVLAANTPNDGSQTITVPNIASSTTVRIKVKAVNNVFFNLSPVNFVLTHNTGLKDVSWQDAFSLFPVPANNVLHLMSLTTTILKIDIANAVGQKVYSGQLNKKLDIPVTNWAKGVYYVILSDVSGGEKVVRPVVIE